MDSIEHSDFSNLEIDVASLPQYEEVRLISLERKYLWKLHLSTTISFLFFLVGLVLAYVFLEDYREYVLSGILLIFLIFGWSYYVNVQLMKRNGYGLRERDVIYQRGFLFEKTTVVPFNRVQHVSVQRSVLDKFLGLATLKIFTAGGSGSDVNIPGLSPETATSLKEEVSARIFDHA